MTTPSSAGDVLALVRSGRARTRADLARLTGLSRTAITARVDRLYGAGLLAESGDAASTGGRPPGTLRLRAETAVVVAAAVGRSRSQVGVADLGGALLAEDVIDQEPGIGPADLMPRLVTRARELLRGVGRPDSDVVAVGLSIPGIVDAEAAASRDSPILPGWDGVPLARHFALFSGAPVLLDNDVNVLAVSERGALGAAAYNEMLVVKVSTGIGAGLVVRGELARGGSGSAGELGHVKTAAARGRPCRCGEAGCLEAVAGGWALVEAMREEGVAVAHVRDVADLALSGDATARRLVRQAGRRIGEPLAVAVNLLNPEAVIIGGDLAVVDDLLVAGMREVVYSNASVLNTRHLEFRTASHGQQAGLRGCAFLALDAWLAPAAVDQRLVGR